MISRGSCSPAQSTASPPADSSAPLTSSATTSNDTGTTPRPVKARNASAIGQATSQARATRPRPGHGRRPRGRARRPTMRDERPGGRDDARAQRSSSPCDCRPGSRKGRGRSTSTRAASAGSRAGRWDAPPRGREGVQGEPAPPWAVSGCPDLNWGPLRPERSALPGCATPRNSHYRTAGRLARAVGRTSPAGAGPAAARGRRQKATSWGARRPGG